MTVKITEYKILTNKYACLRKNDYVRRNDYVNGKICRVILLGYNVLNTSVYCICISHA